MSMVTHLCIDSNGYMHCECPSCQAECEVNEDDLHGTLMDGKNNDTKEYRVTCDECGQEFYTSSAYM